MSAKSPHWAQKLLLLVFKNTAAREIGDAGGLRGSVLAGHLYVALHVGPDRETSYGGYARSAVMRGPGFLVHGTSVSPAADVSFPKCVGNPGPEITHVGIWTQKSGGMLLYSGAAEPPIKMALGVVPQWEKSSTITEA